MFKIIHKVTGKEVTIDNILSFADPYINGSFLYWKFIGDDSRYKYVIKDYEILDEFLVTMDRTIYLARYDIEQHCKTYKELPSEIFEVQEDV